MWKLACRPCTNLIPAPPRRRQRRIPSFYESTGYLEVHSSGFFSFKISKAPVPRSKEGLETHQPVTKSRWMSKSRNRSGRASTHYSVGTRNRYSKIRSPCSRMRSPPLVFRLMGEGQWNGISKQRNFSKTRLMAVQILGEGSTLRYYAENQKISTTRYSEIG